MRHANLSLYLEIAAYEQSALSFLSTWKWRRSADKICLSSQKKSGVKLDRYGTRLRDWGLACSSDIMLWAQHFVFGFHGHDVSEDIKTLICEYYLGYVVDEALGCTLGLTSIAQQCHFDEAKCAKYDSPIKWLRIIIRPLHRHCTNSRSGTQIATACKGRWSYPTSHDWDRPREWLVNKVIHLDVFWCDLFTTGLVSALSSSVTREAGTQL